MFDKPEESCAIPLPGGTIEIAWAPITLGAYIEIMEATSGDVPDSASGRVERIARVIAAAVKSVTIPYRSGPETIMAGTMAAELLRIGAAVEVYRRAIARATTATVDEKKSEPSQTQSPSTAGSLTAQPAQHGAGPS